MKWGKENSNEKKLVEKKIIANEGKKGKIEFANK